MGAPSQCTRIGRQRTSCACRATAVARASSLLELIVVVVVIGLLAALAIPRLSRGGAGAARATLRADLRRIRTAIERYSTDHDGQWPGADALSSTCWNQLTSRTDRSGSWTAPQITRVYGPYLHGKVGVPVGPNRGAHILLMTTVTPLADAISEGQTGKGWVYNYLTAELIANTDDVDEAGLAFADY